VLTTKKKKGERSCLLTCLLAYFFVFLVVVEGAYAKRFFCAKEIMKHLGKQRKRRVEQ
jgi:hypothetical protein